MEESSFTPLDIDYILTLTGPLIRVPPRIRQLPDAFGDVEYFNKFLIGVSRVYLSNEYTLVAA